VQYAGGNFYAPTTYYTTLSSFLSDTTNIDILIDETYLISTPTLGQALASYGLSQANSTQYKWVNNFFREDGLVTQAYGFDWLDGGDVMEDAALADIINVINPSLPYPQYKRVWLRNVSSSEQPTVITASQCTNVNSTTLADYAPVCANIPQPISTTTTTTTATATSSAGSCVMQMGLLVVGLTMVLLA